MPTGIGIAQRIIPHVTVPVQVLRVVIPWHDRIRADEVVDIRRRRPSPLVKKKGQATTSTQTLPALRYVVIDNLFLSGYIEDIHL